MGNSACVAAVVEAAVNVAGEAVVVETSGSYSVDRSRIPLADHAATTSEGAVVNYTRCPDVTPTISAGSSYQTLWVKDELVVWHLFLALLSRISFAQTWRRSSVFYLVPSEHRQGQQALCMRN